MGGFDEMIESIEMSKLYHNIEFSANRLKREARL